MIDQNLLASMLAGTPAAPWLERLPQQLDAALAPNRHGKFPEWQSVLTKLPSIQPSEVELVDAVTIGRSGDANAETIKLLEQTLKGLNPWRKGPFHLFGIHIDAEWRSDWKWERLKDAIAPLRDRRVLDVGCGNGYYSLRMLGAGAKSVLGVDPSPLFLCQFLAIQKYAQQAHVQMLPLGIEAMPQGLHAFDTAFSMGVLYHRRDPLEHLQTLKQALVPGGQLVLETLVIDEGLGEVLVPEKRYARMRNVWSIPSCSTLKIWLKDCGFSNIEIVDVSPTTVDEQRATEWMTFQSLADFLNPENSAETIEGYPAPLRAIALATG